MIVTHPAAEAEARRQQEGPPQGQEEDSHR